ncbi:DUF4123 domain-containing protein [Thalassospira marina]|uniref:DUF4123 domain-containing protein n=1 Tax=Thalassospira marina TaxID=2048283 RepID=A0ABM6QFS2_9PROT|nr:DUF4123 domain-containing protein [Thalassospira marina]AUG55451.1 hypothetical protein CSC3H3_21555 [Thalassospira marina]
MSVDLISDAVATTEPWLAQCHFVRVPETGADGGNGDKPAGSNGAPDTAIQDDDPFAFAAETNDHCKGLVAVLTGGREDFEAALEKFLGDQPLKLLWCEDIMPATRWMMRYPKDKFAVELARMVHDYRPVEIGPLSTADGGIQGEHADAIWADLKENITPLDDQFGVWPRKNVPDDLADILFGDIDKTGKTGLATYAVIDASKMRHLAENLASSGLEYRCLFTGEAGENLGDVAPYLVKLDRENRFSSDLLSKGDRPWQHWDSEAALFVRSAAGFDDIWRHMRKFTKIRDAGDKWFFLRFWDRMFVHYLHEHPKGPFPDGFFREIDVVIAPHKEGAVRIVGKTGHDATASEPFFETFSAFVAGNKRNGFIDRVAAFFAAKYEEKPENDVLISQYQRARQLTMVSELAVLKTMEAQFLLHRAGKSADALDTDAIPDFDNMSDVHRADALLEQATNMASD